MTIDGLTPVQKKMLAVLADGKRHGRERLHKCLSDELGPLSNIRAHLTALRKRLPEGQEIVCEICYRLVQK